MNNYLIGISYVSNRSLMSSIDGLLSRAASDIFGPVGGIPDLFKSFPVHDNPTDHLMVCKGTRWFFGPQTHKKSTSRAVELGRPSIGLSALEQQQVENAAYWERIRSHGNI